jgi:DNA-binding phage protein
MKIEAIRMRLAQASQKHGELARIARESGVTYRTLFNILKGERETKSHTILRLAAQFRKEDRRVTSKEEVKA